LGSNKKVFFVSLVALVTYFSKPLWGQILQSVGEQLVFLASVLLFAVAIMKYLPNLPEWPLEVINNNILVASIFSSLLFAIAHAFNFPFTNTYAWFLSVSWILLTYFVGGYLLAKLRIKKGLPYSILVHSLNNSLIILPLLTFE